MGDRYRLEIHGVLDIDLDAYAAAALEAEHTSELLTDPDEILNEVGGHFPIEDAIPRWARDAITFVSETHTTTPVPEVGGRVAAQMATDGPDCTCRAMKSGIRPDPSCPVHGGA